MRKLYIGFSVLMALSISGALSSQVKVVSGEIPAQSKVQVQQAMKKKFPNISQQRLNQAIFGKNLSEVLGKWVDLKDLSKGEGCDLSRSLLTQRADQVKCQEFKEFLVEVAESGTCNTVDEVLEQVGMAVIGTCTYYFNDAGDPWGSCGCGGCACCMLL